MSTFGKVTGIVANLVTAINKVRLKRSCIYAQMHLFQFKKSL